MEAQSVHSELTLPKVGLIFLSHFLQSGWICTVKLYGFISSLLLCVFASSVHSLSVAVFVFLLVCHRQCPLDAAACLSLVHPSVKGGRHQLWLNWVTLETLGNWEHRYLHLFYLSRCCNILS